MTLREIFERFMVDVEKIIDNGGTVETMYDNGQLDQAEAEILEWVKGLVLEKREISCKACPQRTLKRCPDKWRCEDTIKDYNDVIDEILKKLEG